MSIYRVQSLERAIMYLFAVEASSFTYISNVLYKQWCRSFSLRTQAMYTKRI